MTTISALLYLIFFGVAGGFITYIVLGFAGLPGNIIAGKPSVRSKTRFMIGTLIAAFGQAYIYLAYSAFVIAWTQVKLSDGNSIKFLVWIFAFLAVLLPVLIGSGFSNAHEKEKKLPYANALVEGLPIVVLLTFIGFFVFAFVPSTMHTLWGWVPFVSK